MSEGNSILVYAGSVAENGHNTRIEAVAGREGITIDEAVLIPWESIEAARIKLESSPPHCDREP